MMPPHDESSRIFSHSENEGVPAGGDLLSNGGGNSATQIMAPAAISTTITPGKPSPPPDFPMMMTITKGGAKASTGPSTEFHPDFMFCGSCTTCQPEEKNTGSSNDGGEASTFDDYLQKQHKNDTHFLNGGNGADSEGEDDMEATHETILIVTSSAQSPSSASTQTLLMQSLLQPLAGVETVVVEHDPNSDSSSNSNNNKRIRVRHTLQTSQVQLVAALKRGDFNSHVMSAAESIPSSGAVSLSVSDGLVERPSASHQNNNTSTKDIVRSQFHVGGICCAMEIPVIRNIVRPLFGVETLQINITTKQVYVQHNATSISAEAIASNLLKEGFPSDIIVDGRAQYLAQQQRQLLLQSTNGHTDDTQNSHLGRTTLRVQGRELQDQDAIILQESLSNIPGIEKVTVNVQENSLLVEHDTDLVDSHSLPSLASKNYPLEVVQTAQEERQTNALFQQLSNDSGEDHARHHHKSKYVESTLVIDNLQHRNVPTIQIIFKQNYIRAQTRACFAHVPSQTIKVEHNPELLSVHDIPKLLEPYGLKAHVAVDGQEAGLILPTMEDYGPQHQHGAKCNSMGDEMMMEDDSDITSSLHMHVVLSGIFWVLSMLSAIGGIFHYFEYFGLLSVFFGLPPVARKAWRTIRRRQFDSNCMMVTAALGALALREFDEAASVAFLFSISEYLEAQSTSKARKALKAIVQLRPEHACVVNPATKEIVIVPASQVPVGSLISVRMGDKIASDGVVVEGVSTVDESSLTGESKPIMKRADDTVSGGTINVGTTQLIIKTTSSIEDSVVSRLIKVVEDAQSSRSMTEKMIDRFAKTYTPFVVCLAGFMCTVPWIFGAETGRYWTLNGLIIIVIACPCSLTISTPVTYAAGLAATAQRGIIVKGGAHLESLGAIKTVVFDKTNTLTHGKFRVDHLQEMGTAQTRKEMLELLALMEAPSSHPLSATLVRAAAAEGVSIPRDADVTLHTVLKGEGVTAKVNGKQAYVGNQRLFDRLGFYEKLPFEFKQLATGWAGNGATVGFIGIEGLGIIGGFSMIDTIRDEAADTVQALQMLDINVVMLTGDGKGAADAVARQVGIPPSCVHSHLMPEDKLHYVGSLIQPDSPRCDPFKPKSKVLFIGDGINDTPALAVADVGVSMGEGAAALAMEVSDVTLMDSNLSKLLYVINMGSRVVKTIQENIAISLLSKLLVVVLTFSGKMTLFGAIAADVGVMLLVTLNGMKLLPGSTDDDDSKSKSKRRLFGLSSSTSKYDKVLGDILDDIDTSDSNGDVELGTIPSGGEQTSDESPELFTIV